MSRLAVPGAPDAPLRHIRRIATAGVAAGLALAAGVGALAGHDGPAAGRLAWWACVAAALGLAALLVAGSVRASMRRRAGLPDTDRPAPELLDRLHLLELLLRTTPQGFWFIDMAGVTRDVNPAMCTLLGRPREQIVGRSVFDFFAGADLLTLRAQIEARREGQAGGYEIGISRPDGTRVHCFNNATPVHDSRGARIGSIGLWTDISVRRQAETALRTYELVANSITDMVSVVGEDLVYRMVNDAWCRRAGRARDEVIGRQTSNVMAAVSRPERRAALLACIDTQQVQVVRDRMPLPGLAGRTVETTYYPYVDVAADVRCVVMVTRDVTEQEARRQQLAASELELRTLLDAFPGFITRVDEQRTFTYANPQVAARLGTTQERMIGKPIREVVGAEREQWLMAYFERAWRGEAVTYERQHVTAAGETLTDQVSLVVGIDPRNGTRSIYTFGVDVTERKRAEEQLRVASEQLQRKTHQLELTLDSIAQGIVNIDVDGRTTLYNRRALELLDLPEALLQPQSTFNDVVRYQIARGELAPDARYLDADGQWQTIPGGREHAPEVYVRRNHLGMLIEVRTRRMADGSLVRTYADVTRYYQTLQDLRRSETELRALLDAFPGYIATIDGGDVYRYVNERFTRLFDRPARDLLGQPVRAVVGESHFAGIRRDLERARLGERVVSERVYADRVTHQPVHLEVTHVAGPAGADGERTCYVFALDVSAHRRAEAELVFARDEAERANRAKSQFVSHMSHELRTPMNAILGFGQLLESDTAHPLADHQRQHVAEILRGGRHLLGLINELLDLGSIEAGQLQVDGGVVALDPLVDDCLNLVRPLADAHGIRLLAPQFDAAGQHVAADRTRLKQVLLNLLGNAIKYNRPAGSVSLHCRRDGAQVEVGITDTGRGLSAEAQRRLFRPFERLDAAQAGIEGTGIGLALSRRLIEAMDGTIGVDSEVGRGSTFWIRLHAADVPAAHDGAADRLPAVPDVAAPATTSHRTVLYIEDNPVNTLLMKALLARMPRLRFLEAATPAAGLELARQERPALILLDIGLPGMDGYEVLRRLRLDPRTRDIPVVAVTASAMPAEVAAGLAAGFAEYLTKPFDLPRMIEVVGRLIDAPRSDAP